MVPDSTSELPDIDDLGSWGESAGTRQKDGGMFGSGWQPWVEDSAGYPDQSLRQAQVPEAEEEANGWEIVPPIPSRGRTSSFDVSLPEKARTLPDGVPEDLVMGCLDPECDALFGPGCERQRCGSCRFSFCSHHLRGPWYLSSFFGETSANPVSGSGSGGSQNTAPLLESLGLPLGPGQVYLCKLCHQALPFPSLVAADGSVDAHLNEEQTGSRILSPADAANLPGAAQVLWTHSFAALSETGEEEDSARTSARWLIFRLLDQLRVCLRPWTEAERDWVWRLAEELVQADPRWIAQLARQASWDSAKEAKLVANFVEKAHSQQKLKGREALQVLGVLGRSADPAASSLGERRLGLLATHAAEAIGSNLGPAELACCLELLLDAAHELGAAGATGGRRAVVGTLLKASQGTSSAALRGEFFWALEARVMAAAAARRSDALIGGGPDAPAAEAWASVALQELLRDQPQEIELGLLRQQKWVRHLEQGENACCCVEPAWGETRGFPLAVWPATRMCLGMEGFPHDTDSKSAPIIVRCRFRDETAPAVPSSRTGPGTGASQGDALASCRVPPSSSSSSSSKSSSKHRDPRRKTAGLLLKKDADMHIEQQVGQTLRLLETLIWEDEGLQALLHAQGLSLEDVRATFVIVMTGPGTGMMEFVEGARTLKEVRSGRSAGSALGQRLLLSPGERGTLLTFLRQHNSGQDLPKSLARLAFTSAVSAVLCFVAGLGDRHHENFMVTVDGRLVHVDYGYALGREPLDSVLIHYAVQGTRPATTLQYEELQDALGGDRLRRIFWPVVRAAYLRVRQHPGLLAEMFHAALMRKPRRDLRGNSIAAQRAWSSAQAFVARNCVTSMSEHLAARFIHSLLVHCTRHERGTHLRDELKCLRLKEKTHQAVSRTFSAAKSTGRSALTTTKVAASLAADVVSAGPSLNDLTSAARGMASGLFGGVRELVFETSLLDERQE